MKYKMRFLLKDKATYESVIAYSIEELITELTEHGCVFNDAEKDDVIKWIHRSYSGCKLYCWNCVLERING